MTVEVESDIWNTILDSVSKTKQIKTKNLIFLGEKQSGKSTLLNELKLLFDPDYVLNDKKVNDLALSYSYCELKDELDSEETFARLGFFQLSGDNSSKNLLPFALEKNLQNSVVIICLDWSKPHLFISELKKFLVNIENVFSAACLKEKITIESLKEEVEEFFRSYVDPISNDLFVEKKSEDSGSKDLNNFAGENKDQRTPASISLEEKARNLLLPLGEGVLSNNLGLKLLIVCTKSDQTTVLERDQEYREEKFDLIQQVLRTVCLKFGAALFYTSTHKISSIQLLKDYLYYLAFNQNATELSKQKNKNKSQQQQQTQQPHGSGQQNSFNQKALVIERDEVFVPIGWDSVNKILILEKNFKINEKYYFKENLPTEELMKKIEESYSLEVKKFESIGDSLKISNYFEAEDENKFLESCFNTLSAMGGGGMGSSNLGVSPNSSTSRILNAVTGNSSLSTGTNENESDRQNNESSNTDEDVATKLARLGKLKESSGIKKSTSTESSSSLPSTGKDQNEVLSNFFQALLDKKNTTKEQK